MNTLDADVRETWAAVRRAWPDLPWDEAVFRYGAFHHVAVLDTSAVVRLSTGTGHAARTRLEHDNLAALEHTGLPFRVPVALAEPISGPSWSAQVSDVIPGEHRPDLSWEEVRETLGFVVKGLHDSDLPADALRPVRHWCGGLEWPALVDRITQPLPRASRTRAREVVADVLAQETDGERALVHGDFGLHNVLWSEGQLSGLIDFDNACIGDPAIDIAPLIGAFGAARVADIADPEVIALARTYRASLSLQVAAAADQVGDATLRDFALSNFQKRLEAGTLYDPDLA